MTSDLVQRIPLCEGLFIVFSRRMSMRNSANFCRRIGVGFRAGVDFLRLLDSESRHGTARQRGVMAAVHQSVRMGNQLHVAMKEQVTYFPPLMIAMTHAGEITGKLDRTMIALADYYEDRVKIFREFLGRIMWPMLQLFAAINILALLIYILGVLTPSTGGEMFDVTGFGLRGASGVATLYGYVFVVALMITAVIVAFRKNVAGVQNLIPILYRFPVFGEALQTITLARFCWTLALALDAGMDPIRSIQLGLDATDSDYYRSAKDEVEQSILSGSNISEALLATSVFPDEFITEVQVAEMSGTDAEALHHLAGQYDVRSKAAMRTIAGIASGLVWLLVVVAMIALLLRMIMRIGGAYSEALEPI